MADTQDRSAVTFGLLVFGRQDHKGAEITYCVLLQIFNGFKTIHSTGHHQINDYQIEALFLSQLYSLFAALRQQDLPVFPAQANLQQLTNDRLIINNKYLFHRVTFMSRDPTSSPCRQGKMHNRTFTDTTIHPDPTTMCLDDLLNDIHAETYTFNG